MHIFYEPRDDPHGLSEDVHSLLLVDDDDGLRGSMTRYLGREWDSLTADEKLSALVARRQETGGQAR